MCNKAWQSKASAQSSSQSMKLILTLWNGILICHSGALQPLNNHSRVYLKSSQHVLKLATAGKITLQGFWLWTLFLPCLNCLINWFQPGLAMVAYQVRSCFWMGAIVRENVLHILKPATILKSENYLVSATLK